ncbi:MAG TPA: hypothetical protein PKA77_04545 [Chitinophagaceae bacterium]|nr:hypothetical protein [Chitinophagaceae bacterium]HMU59334.1 hypothetical protein [Chitinophagaceae bacterium]
MIRSVSILFAVALLISCSAKKKEFNGILKPSNISSQYFTIDPSKDTTILTAHAGRYLINKGTFATDEKVTIEIKEIFTPDEILRSGLTTLSDGKMLASAGMLYFNATVNGKKIEPSLPVGVFIPGNNPDPDMKLFTGKLQSDSTINWVDPKEITQDTTRPSRVITKDSLAKSSVTDTSGGSFQTVSDCNDTIYVSKLNTFPEYDNDQSDEGNGTENSAIDTTKEDSNNARNIEKEGFDFQITANGWYNIDAFLKDEGGIENVKLSVDVKSDEDIPLYMYLFVPTERVMISATSKKDNQYFFSYNDDKSIPLPLQHRAIVLGFNSSGKRIMYGAAEFVIEKEQVIPVELKDISKRGLIYLLASKNLNGIEIEAIEKEMQIVPCGEQSTAPALPVSGIDTIPKNN